LRNLNTFPSVGGTRRWLFKWAIAALGAVCLAVPSFAIDPNRTLSQYLHDSWGTERGLPGGPVSAIAQTPDGYLWIGTDKGLVRFDGLNFRLFDQANPGSYVIGPVRKLLTDPQENMWVLLRTTKLFRYHDGTFELSRGEAENGITAMGQGGAGAVLFSSLAMGTLKYDGGRFLTLLPTPALAESASLAQAPDQRSTRLAWNYGLMPDRLAAPTSTVISMAQTSDGKIWLGTQDRGLFYLQDGRVYAAAKDFPNMDVNCILPLENSELWVGTSKGVMRWNGTGLTRAGVPAELLNVEVLSMIRDRDSNLWVGTTRGLFRFNSNGVFLLATALKRPPRAINALFEDREGNIWLGSVHGLERLRDSAFATNSVAGLKSQSMGPLYVDADDHIWFAPVDGGLRWLKGAQSGAVTADGISHDSIYSITGSGKNDIWVGRQRGGLTHLRNIHGAVTAQTYTHTDGLAQNSVYAVYESRDGTVWSGTLSGGVSKLRNGRFTNYTTASGLASNTVSSIAEGTDGTMWFGTPNGLSELVNNSWRTYTARDGLAAQDVNSLLLDSTGVLWIGTGAGLAYLRAGHVQLPMAVPEPLHEPIYGIREDRKGWLWIATAGHVVQVKRASLMGEALKEEDFREYGLADGLPGTEGVKRFQSVVPDSQARIWFSTNRGLAVVNPARAAVNSAPALVHIDAVFADGSPLDLGAHVMIPPAKQRTTFHYAGLSLSNAERVRYRYKLDGFDRIWSEPVTNLEATYGNLTPGSYRFRVMASNGDGLWNGSEAAVGFEVEPTLWQTWWFRLTLVSCVGLAALALYRLRMLHLTQLLNVRFEERLAERTRIAQDLHDTLLQGVLSASMQLHVAVDQLPQDSPARPGLNRVLELVGHVVEEGRNTLRGLRSSFENVDDLTNSLSRIQQELDKQGVNFRVVVEGAPLPLRPAIRDEVYRIGREALVNAFRHSRARNIDLHVEYSVHEFRILVRDDGCGIDPSVLQSGRDGHWGMSGMRERAEKIGAKVKVLSRIGGGTEVELCLPSKVAWEPRHTRATPHWLTALYRRHREKSESESNQRVAS
jgi:ligand-binding sensor domain-containing protein/signal transduction histidine kinase